MEYADFLQSKRIAAVPAGFKPSRPIRPVLKPHQRDAAEWAIRRGKAALFWDTGTGKSLVELEWADHVQAHTGLPVLLLTPIAVGRQMVSEAAKFGIPGVRVVNPTIDIGLAPITVANYEKLHLFNPADFGGIVGDEAGILKSYDGHIRKQVTAFASSIPYRLAATATPAPNDRVELTNQAEFLGIMQGKEVLALFFTQDGNSSSEYKLKPHAIGDFWRWIGSWASVLRKPSDLGHPDDGYDLPPLTHEYIILPSPPLPGSFLPAEAKGLNEQRAVRRATLHDRVKVVADLVASEPSEPWIIWTELNDESTALRKAIPGAVEVTGSQKDSVKENNLVGFGEGRIPVIVSKSKICGFGLNWQHCARIAFAGVSHSFEQTYQAIRRCYRFGQSRPVKVFTVCTEADGLIVANYRRKEAEAASMMEEVIKHAGRLSTGQAGRDETPYRPEKIMRLPSWLKGGAA